MRRDVPGGESERTVLMMSRELSDVAFDDLEVGRRFGPYDVEVGEALAEQLAGEIGARTPVGSVPPAAYPITFLVALRHAMGGIPRGSILAKQELEFHETAPVGSVLKVGTWIGETYVRRGRPYAVIEFDVRGDGGEPVVTGRKVIVWPNGPREE